MSNCVDFPFPPSHYKCPKVLEEFQKKVVANSSMLLSNKFVVFGEVYHPQKSEVSLAPVFHSQCTNLYFKNRGIKNEFNVLIRELCLVFINIFKALSTDVDQIESLALQYKDIMSHMYYLIKILKNTSGAHLTLQSQYRRSTEANLQVISNIKQAALALTSTLKTN